MSSDSSTFRVSPWAPANETEADLWLERSNIDGAVLGGIAYGIHITLFFMCLPLLVGSRKRDPKGSWVFIAYITTNFVLGSIGNAANTRLNELAYVDNRDYPGGPNAYFVEQGDNWFTVVGYGVYIVNTWLQDGLLIYRFLLIWSFNYWVAVVPALLFIVSVIMSCLLLAQLAKPGNSLWGRLSINFGLTYWSISIATTIFVTTLIVSRLLFMRYRLRKIMGPRHQSPYVSLSAMLVESAFLYSTIGLIFIVTFAKNDPAQNLFLPVLGQVQSISPLLIILRVAQGNAWRKDTLRGTQGGSTATGWRQPPSMGSTTYALSTLQSKKAGDLSTESGSTTYVQPTKSRNLGAEESYLPMAI